MRAMRAMRWRWWWLAAVFVAGCGDAVAPVGGGRDLEFAVPVGPVVESASLVRRIESPYPELPAAMAGDADWTNLFYLKDWFVKGWFEGTTFVFEYGLLGYGTGYSMIPKLTIVGSDGRVIPSQPTLGLAEDMGLPFPMRPTAQERVDVNSWCGAAATIGVTFIVRFAPPYLSMIPMMTISRNSSDVSYQAPCPPPSPPAGGDTESGDTVYLCWYEVWYNSLGQVVSYVELSCTKLGGSEY